MSIKLIERGVAESHQVWREQSYCRLNGIPPEVFFPEQHQSLDETISAVTFCVEVCPVREQCLQYALDNNERFGYFGGVSERGRRRIRRLGLTAAEFIASDGGSDIVRRGRPPKNA